MTAKNDAEVIRIEILLEDPVEGYTYPMYCPDVNDSCEPVFDKEFHLDNSMIDAAMELSVQELIAVFNQGIEDSSNNTKDNPEQNTK